MTPLNWLHSMTLPPPLLRKGSEVLGLKSFLCLFRGQTSECSSIALRVVHLNEAHSVTKGFSLCWLHVPVTPLSASCRIKSDWDELYLHSHRLH